MFLLRPSRALLGLALLFTGCSSSKEDGQLLLGRLNKVLEKLTDVLAGIQDQQTAIAKGDELKELTKQWTDLRELDHKFKFSRSTMEQLLNENPEVRTKTSELKLKLKQEYERLQKLKINTDEFQAFELAYTIFRQK